MGLSVSFCPNYTLIILDMTQENPFKLRNISYSLKAIVYQNLQKSVADLAKAQEDIQEIVAANGVELKEAEQGFVQDALKFALSYRKIDVVKSNNQIRLSKAESILADLEIQKDRAVDLFQAFPLVEDLLIPSSSDLSQQNRVISAADSTCIEIDNWSGPGFDLRKHVVLEQARMHPIISMSRYSLRENADTDLSIRSFFA